MTTHKHTPGPWSVYGDAVKVAAHGAKFQAFSPFGDYYTESITDDRGEFRNPADAQLCSAAPDLLDVLGDALSLLDAIDSAVRAEHRKNGAPQSKSVAGIIAERARAAIAKAIGGEA